MEKVVRENFKILIVDDTAALLELAKIMLTKAGFDICTASDGAECISQITIESPDIILLDIILPDINGKDLCRQIKSNPKFSSIFIILLSSHERSTDKIVSGLDDGADGYILRPVSDRELIARIESACRIILTERQLRDSADELTRFNNLMVDRELKMIELKKEINNLLIRLGEKPKYKISE